MAIKEKICDTRMIPVCSETVNTAQNMDIMAMKTLKKRLKIQQLCYSYREIKYA
jgi:hypothetical protein